MTIISPEALDFKKDILPFKGELRFPLTHNYIFTAAFQRNTYAIKYPAGINQHTAGTSNTEMNEFIFRKEAVILSGYDLISDLAPASALW